MQYQVIFENQYGGVDEVLVSCEWPQDAEKEAARIDPDSDGAVLEVNPIA